MRPRFTARVALLAIFSAVSCERDADPGRADPASGFDAAPLLPDEPEAPVLRSRAGVAAPFSLTASDGTGLHLVAVRSRTVIEGPLALTELELSFHNPEARTLEGRFALTLPEGASISRFAMEIDGAWQEGEVVEKQRARQTYETFLHQRKDPALLEQGAGNQFSARVFPITGNATKRLVMTYAEVLDSAHPFEVRLLGLPKMRELDVRVTSEGKQLLALRESDFVPTSDFTVPVNDHPRAVGVAHRDLMVLRGVVPDASTPARPLQDVLLLVDTSAARALDLQRELDALDALVRAMPGDTRISIAAFDQEVSLVFEGEATHFDEHVLHAIEKRQAFGASNFKRALDFVGGLAATNTIARLIFISDGVVTSGPASLAALEPTLDALAEVGIERVDALAIGGLRDRAFLTGLVAAGNEKGTVAEVDAPAEATLERLTRAPLDALAVTVEGATWQSPTQLDGLLPGDEFVVFAKVPTDVRSTGDASSAKMTLGDTSQSVTIQTATSGELLERAHAVAEIAQLESTMANDDAQANARIVALSTQHRVLSRQTAMVVLETNEDYSRFGIDRTATVDILGIENDQIVTRRAGRVDLKQHVARTLPAVGQRGGDSSERTRMPTTLAESPSSGGGLSGIGEGGGGRGEGLGLGGVGTIGRGAGTGSGQGFGSGQGRLGGSHRTRPPSVRMGATTVNGRLPPEVIQRIVRQNFGRFRLCYENGLRENPNLEGEVSISFLITPSGLVKNVTTHRATLPSAGVSECVRLSFEGLSFPQPEGGSVAVVYPIAFSPGGGEASPGGAVEPPLSPPLSASAYHGRFRTVMDALAEGRGEAALSDALSWADSSPSEVLAFVAVGEAAEATGRPRLASRAYGSILDLWAYRVEMKRFAAQRLERIGTPDALELAASAFESAIGDRPDHPSGYRMLAYASLKQGDARGAFTTVEQALALRLPEGRYAGVLPLLREDAALIATNWLRQDPAASAEINARLRALSLEVDAAPSVRFVLSWETDANDVDLHVVDGKGNHAFFGSPTLLTGGKLIADVTTGYGPEGFVIRGKPQAFPYTLRANYYARGVMGFGMGKVQVVRHDGKGLIQIEERPFVIQSNLGDVELGLVRAD